MQCPACGGILVHENLAGVQLEVCSTCAGMWFDEGELGKVLEGDQVQVQAFDEEREPIAAPAPVQNRRCPKCSMVMLTMNYQYSGPVKLETCDGCGGLFLDSGELATIETMDDGADPQDLKANMALGVANLEQGAKDAKVKAYYFVRNSLIRKRSSLGFRMDLDHTLGEYPKD